MKLQIFRYLKSFFLRDSDKLKKIKFDFLLPIGSSCQTRYQIERFLKYKYKLKQPACFFDWLGLGGIRGVAKIIANDFSLKSSDFKVKSMYGKDNFSPIHMPSGFRFQHDFGLSPEIKKKKPLVEDSMEKSMGVTLAKYQYLANRTEKILKSDRSIGLVYRGKMRSSDVDMLFNILSEKYGSQFYILNILKVGLEKDFIQHERVINISIFEKGEKLDWRGDDLSWNKALKKVHINNINLYS